MERSNDWWALDCDPFPLNTVYDVYSTIWFTCCAFHSILNEHLISLNLKLIIDNALPIGRGHFFLVEGDSSIIF